MNDNGVNANTADNNDDDAANEGSLEVITVEVRASNPTQIPKNKSTTNAIAFDGGNAVTAHDDDDYVNEGSLEEIAAENEQSKNDCQASIVDVVVDDTKNKSVKKNLFLGRGCLINSFSS